MWPNPQFPADLVTFTEEIINGKVHLYSACECDNLRMKAETANCYLFYIFLQNKSRTRNYDPLNKPKRRQMLSKFH